MQAIEDEALATTNLWYARLCKSAASVGRGALNRWMSVEDRRILIAALVALPKRGCHTDAAGRMEAERIDRKPHRLSMLGAEAVAAASQLDGSPSRLGSGRLAWARPCCTELGRAYSTLQR